MKIAATIISCRQVSESSYQEYSSTYIFDSSQSIDEMLKVTGAKTISEMNLSTVVETGSIHDKEGQG